ncbi:MAG: hypothetical protein ABIB72_01385 [Candidatus Falkowbacteria bacterium]
MENIKRMLAEMVKQGLISPAVELFLKNFLSNMRLERDIKKADIDFAVKEMAGKKFGSGLGLNTEFLTGDFKRLAPDLIAEGALVSSANGNSPLDLAKIFFVFCQIHDALKTKN